jgi:hypothetical protein
MNSEECIGPQLPADAYAGIEKLDPPSYTNTARFIAAFNKGFNTITSRDTLPFWEREATPQTNLAPGWEAQYCKLFDDDTLANLERLYDLPNVDVTKDTQPGAYLILVKDKTSGEIYMYGGSGSSMPVFLLRTGAMKSVGGLAAPKSSHVSNFNSNTGR